MDSKDFFSKEDIYNDVLLYSYQNPVKPIDDNACEDLKGSLGTTEYRKGD